MNELLEIFDLYDVHHRGALPRSEIVNVIRSAGVHVSQKDAEAYLLFDGPAAATVTTAPAPTKPGTGKPNTATEKAAVAAPQRNDVRDALMSRDEFCEFVEEKDFVSKVVTAAAASNVKGKAHSELLSALQAFDYKEHGYLTRSEVVSILTTMNEKVGSASDLELALRGAEWFDGDADSPNAKVKLEALARYLTRHYTSVSISNEEVLGLISK